MVLSHQTGVRIPVALPIPDLPFPPVPTGSFSVKMEAWSGS